MKTFVCTCKNSLYFENFHCLSCHSEVGWCPACQQVVPISAAKPSGYRCGNSSCGALLQKCHNYAVGNVCNRCLVAGADGKVPEALCDCCRYNDTIPDLSVPGNHEKWYRLEVAKRRLFYELNLLGLRYGKAEDGVDPPLAFDFKADVIPVGGVWRTMGKAERVFTGHENGKITLNIREADDAEREKLRVDMKEAHRTVIGHFRHEIGHYYWEMLIAGECEPEFQKLFGDHLKPPYQEALERYYKEGPPADWQQRFISAYASMHPWEDFAETFATYLDMVSVLDTAWNLSFGGPDVRTGDFPQMLEHYQRLGLVLNEFNRSMGLKDLLPDFFPMPVQDKMHFVHDLIRE